MDEPLSVRLSTLARAVGLPERTIRTWADSGRLRTWRHPDGGPRYVTSEELQRLEAGGVPLDWDVLLGFDPPPGGTGRTGSAPAREIGA